MGEDGWTVVNFDIFSRDGFDLSGASPGRPKSFSECMDKLVDIFDDFTSLSVVSLIPLFYGQSGQLAIGNLIPECQLAAVVSDYLSHIRNHRQDIVETSQLMDESLRLSMAGDHHGSRFTQADWVVSMQNLYSFHPQST